jgi:hypothetical protein
MGCSKAKKTMSDDKKESIQQVNAAKKRRKFLDTLAQTGKVAFSARAAGYKDSMQLYHYRRDHEDFAKEWGDAETVAAELLIDEATRRAVEGVDKPIVYKGEVVGYEKEYSDQLLMCLLRAKRPDQFGNNVQVSGAISHAIGVAILPMRAASIEEWERAALDVSVNQRLLTPPKDVTPVATATPELVRR